MVETDNSKRRMPVRTVLTIAEQANGYFTVSCKAGVRYDLSPDEIFCATNSALVAEFQIPALAYAEEMNVIRRRP